MYYRTLPLVLVHVTYTLLYVIGGLITQQHSVWSLLSALGLSHVCTGLMVSLYIGQRDDDMTDGKVLADRPYIVAFLVTSVLALAMAGLVGTIVVTCHPSITLAVPFVVAPSYAAEVRDEWRYKLATVALFLTLISFIFVGHLASVIWASILVRRSNMVMKVARL
jgi:hypothetical protein